MTRKHKGPGEKQWWDARSMKNAGSPLSHSGSGLEVMVGVSGFAPVAAPEKPPVEQPSYEPDSKPEPDYQPKPLGGRGIPPNEPPERKGLSGRQKFGLGAGIAAVVLAGQFSLTPRQGQYDSVSTPTPVATATPMSTAHCRFHG